MHNGKKKEVTGFGSFFTVIIVGEEGTGEPVQASHRRRDRRTVVGASKREACYTDKAEAMPSFSAFTARICPGVLFPTRSAAEV